jgi:uncharacterized protein YegL
MADALRTLDEVLHLMRDSQGAKSLTEFADELGVSKQYLSNVFNGHSPPSERLLDRFGCTHKSMYAQKIKQEKKMSTILKVGCAHCPQEFDTDKELLDHVSQDHPEKLRRPSKETAKLALVNVILDKSGSMLTKAQDVIGGFNRYIADLRKDADVRYLFTLSLFDTDFVERYVAEPLANVRDLDDKAYVPEGNTALNDAIGRTIRLIEGDTRQADKIITVIMTDGEENSSREFSHEAVRTLIQQKEKDGWAFIFLGASPNAWAQGMSYGISPSNVARYDPGMYVDTYAAAAHAVRSVTAGLAPAAACFSATPDSMLRSANLHVNRAPGSAPTHRVKPTPATSRKGWNLQQEGK